MLSILIVIPVLLNGEGVWGINVEGSLWLKQIVFRYLVLEFANLVVPSCQKRGRFRDTFHLASAAPLHHRADFYLIDWFLRMHEAMSRVYGWRKTVRIAPAVFTMNTKYAADRKSYQMIKFVQLSPIPFAPPNKMLIGPKIKKKA